MKVSPESILVKITLSYLYLVYQIHKLFIVTKMDIILFIVAIDMDLIIRIQNGINQKLSIF